MADLELRFSPASIHGFRASLREPRQIATIVFGVALLTEGGAIASEYGQLVFPQGSTGGTFSGSGLSSVLASGVAGIVLGILALGILAIVLTSSTVLSLVALLVLGVTILLSGSAASDAVVSLMRPYTETEPARSDIARGSSYGAELARKPATGVPLAFWAPEGAFFRAAT